MGGPLRPGAAARGALLQVAHLRAECVRTGVRDITVTKSPALSGGGLLATMSPLTLPQSRQMRLARLYKGASYRAESDELRLPVKGGASLADDLVAALVELVPDVAPAGSSPSDSAT